MEKLLPLVRYAEPLVCFDVFNSYTVELIEAGRKHEARNISRIVLTSPFAPHYPECQETVKDLKEPNRSSVAVPSIRLERARPETTAMHHASQPQPESESQQPAGVVSFPPLKEAPPPQKPERLPPRELARLTASEKGELLLAVIKSGTLLDDDYDRIMDIAGLLEGGPASKVLDLEDDKVLDNIAVVWSNNVEPEEFAAVMSALRDCDDDFRRNEIIDRMIHVAFEQTLLCTMTEDEWRRKVERRLPRT